MVEREGTSDSNFVMTSALARRGEREGDIGRGALHDRAAKLADLAALASHREDLTRGWRLGEN